MEYSIIIISFPYLSFYYLKVIYLLSEYRFFIIFLCFYSLICYLYLNILYLVFILGSDTHNKYICILCLFFVKSFLISLPRIINCQQNLSIITCVFYSYFYILYLICYLIFIYRLKMEIPVPTKKSINLSFILLCHLLARHNRFLSLPGPLQPLYLLESCGLFIHFLFIYLLYQLCRDPSDLICAWTILSCLANQVSSRNTVSSDY